MSVGSALRARELKVTDSSSSRSEHTSTDTRESGPSHPSAVPVTRSLLISMGGAENVSSAEATESLA
eukprot:CAMPEP_0202851232 /NCGR_PEP_ID=MMETSP1389-20130828/85759_1 /ASSEMBLY_ACC=CAM_ASM_000865 /TAXON_ID=302021 /ORGANISM="Rhodomonas sp., Strain CCMP768" /LENGTH=66 /DNA_ID=CAMNT_0049529519 /DNA_START=102 /DNA_END=298 /DNA_ORIENTATION=+